MIEAIFFASDFKILKKQTFVAKMSYSGIKFPKGM